MHKYYKSIATDKLNIEKFKNCFKSRKSFETKDIVFFYNKIESDVPKTTINWRIYSLVQLGIINRIGRGKFILGERKTYIPEISPKMKAINRKLTKEFPFLKICIWNTSALNEFMVHQTSRFYILVEVEKEATQSIFYSLKEAKYSVFIDPTRDILERYLPREKESLIIRSLVSESPLQTVKGNNTASLEKMLVDIFCDDVLFSAHQGSEMRTLFKEALYKYSINENRMFRYADRRRKKQSFIKYLNSISNLRQQN